MRANPMTLAAVLLAVSGAGHAQEPAASESMFDSLERKLELGRHEQLLAKKRDTASRLSEFTSDGCSGGLSVGWNYLSTEEVARIYKVIGDLMYRAVRIGGVPCSGLPWRWGYGWPECD